MVAVRRYDCVVALAIAAGVRAPGDTRDVGAVNPGRAVGAPGSGEQLTSPRTAPVIKPEDRMAQFPSVPLGSRLQQIDASKQALPNEAVRHPIGIRILIRHRAIALRYSVTARRCGGCTIVGRLDIAIKHHEARLIEYHRRRVRLLELVGKTQLAVERLLVGRQHV
jgi:hypothetical protein